MPTNNSPERTLTPEQNERVKKALQSIVDDRFGGKPTHAARAIGISHSSINEILNDARGAGMRAVSAIARYLDKGVEELIDGVRKRPRLPETSLGTAPWWDEVRADAERRYGGRLDPSVVDDVARMSFARAPEQFTAEDIKRLHDMLVDIYSRNPKAKEAARRSLTDK